MGVNAQGYAALIAEGKFDAALELVRQDLPLPGICGRICHHPCEADCRRADVEEAVSIRALKRFIADYDAVVESRKRALPYMLEAHRKVWQTDIGMQRFVPRTR